MNTYTTATLIGVIQSLIRPVSSLLDRYFPTIVKFDTEEVHVDVIPGKRPVAPLVSPLVEGKVVESQGFRTNIIRPAYVKPKMRFEPQRFLKRRQGEQIGGSLSPQERMNLQVATDLELLIGMTIRRKELMASEALRTGKVTLQGEKYPTTVVDFGRTASHTVANLTGTAAWSNASSNPFDTFQSFSDIGLQDTGIGLADAIMGIDAWKSFRDHAKVEKRLLQLNASGTQMDRSIQSVEGLQYMGTIDRVNLYVYAGWYNDPDTGTLTELWPAKALAMTAEAGPSGEQGLAGQQLHGAIQDPKAGLQPLEFFPKMWDEEDPAVRWLMVQSAPLVAPQRPDASVYCADVVTG